MLNGTANIETQSVRHCLTRTEITEDIYDLSKTFTTDINYTQ